MDCPCGSTANYASRSLCRGCGAPGVKAEPPSKAGTTRPPPLKPKREAAAGEAAAVAAPVGGMEVDASQASEAETMAGSTKPVSVLIAEWEAVVKAAEATEQGGELLEQARLRVTQLRNQQKQEIQAVMDQRPALSRVQAGQAKVERLSKSVAEREQNVVSLRKQLAQAEQELQDTKQDHQAAQEEVQKAAAEMAGADKEAALAEQDEEILQLRQRLELSESTKHQMEQRVAERAVIYGRWLATNTVEEAGQKQVLRTALQDFPAHPPDLDDMIKQAVAHPPSAEEKQATEEKKKALEAAGRQRSRSPPREAVVRELIVAEHEATRKKMQQMLQQAE